MYRMNLLSGDPGHQTNQFVNRNHPVLAQVDRVRLAGLHQAVDTFHAIVHVAIRACLVSVSPDFNGAPVAGQRYLAANRGGRFLAASFESAQRTEDVVKADDARVESEILRVVPAHAFGIEFFPAIAVFGVGRVGVGFFERRDVLVALQVARINAGAGRIEKPLNLINPRRFDRVKIDQRVIPHDRAFVLLDETDAAHVCGESIDMIHASRRDQGIVEAAQVEQFEFMRG